MGKLVPDRNVEFDPVKIEPDMLEEKTLHNQPNLHSPTYKDITIEEHAYRKQGDEAKQLFTYDQSLEHLTIRGYTRHFRPAEAFGITINGIEGTLAPELQPIYDDMRQHFGEWLNMAFERKGDILTTYLDPVGLIWDKKKRDYVNENFSYAEKKEFGIAGMQSNSWIPLNKINPELILYLYGRPFEDLPAEFQQEAHLYLPRDGVGRPVGRGDVDYSFNLNADNYQGVSRGVRETQPPKKRS